MRLARTLAALAAGCLLAGCGADGGADQPPASPPASDARAERPASTPTRPASPARRFDVARRARWELRTVAEPIGDRSTLDDATMNVLAWVGKPVAATAEALPSAFQRLADVCAADPERDLAIPLRLEIANTSASELSPELELVFSGTSGWSYGEGLSLSVATSFDDTGATCRDGLDVQSSPNGPHGFSVAWRGLPAGDHGTQELVAIVRGWVAPEYPDGQPETVDWLRMTFDPALITSSDDRRQLYSSCYRGPANVAGGPAGNDRTIALTVPPGEQDGASDASYDGSEQLYDPGPGPAEDLPVC